MNRGFAKHCAFCTCNLNEKHLKCAICGKEIPLNDHYFICQYDMGGFIPVHSYRCLEVLLQFSLKSTRSYVL